MINTDEALDRRANPYGMLFPSSYTHLDSSGNEQRPYTYKLSSNLDITIALLELAQRSEQ